MWEDVLVYTVKTLAESNRRQRQDGSFQSSFRSGVKKGREVFMLPTEKLPVVAVCTRLKPPWLSLCSVK